jgi:hypothetical protein
MRFQNVGEVEQVVWNARLADLPRAENRAILQRTYNGEPPYDKNKDQENSRQVNRNFLHGTRVISEARRQWNGGFLRPSNYFSVTVDSGPAHKRSEWQRTITRHINRQLKRDSNMMEQVRATGAQVMLHGIGPVVWTDRRDPIPRPIPIASLMIASETDIDFRNLDWYAMFQEWTPTQLYQMTHGPKVDPGWNMKAVDAQWSYMREQLQKEPNSTAYQYMPERIEELAKQDLAFWGSDAVPTIDVWDVKFRDDEDGSGWYRRIFLDWNVGEGEMKSYKESGGRPETQNKEGWLYTSGKRKYCDNLSQVLHVQYADTSCFAPFKYHSVRSLGWMMWPVVDLLNRLNCQFTENVFMNLLWWFRAASKQDFDRVKKAMFEHMGVIPQGISMIRAEERFKPDPALLELAFGSFRQTISENAASFTQDFDKGNSGKEMTATETMARINNTNALVSGMLDLAYKYAIPQYREISRRFCLPNSPYKAVRDFRLACLKDGVPAEMLDVEKWEVEPDKVMGGGNKTLELAIGNQLLQIRKNLGPDAQRKVDHTYIEVVTDDPAVAEDLAPLKDQKMLSPSKHDAQLSTDRILRGLKFDMTPEMVPEDYVVVWLGDMAALIQQYQQAPPDVKELAGMGNLGQHIGVALQQMAGNDDEKQKVKEFGKVLSGLMKNLHDMAAQLQKQQAQPQDNGGVDAKTAATLKGKMIIDQAKAANTRESHAARTAQRQAQWELEQQRKDRELANDMRRKNLEAQQELGVNAIKAMQEVHHNRLKSLNDDAGGE